MGAVHHCGHPLPRGSSPLLPQPELLVQLLQDHMCTYNMHILVCSLKKQELARGCTGKDGEGCVKRGMGRSKSNV